MKTTHGLTSCVSTVLVLQAWGLLLPVGRAWGEETVGVPWTGEPGITETVGQIMERERLAPRIDLSRVRETHREIDLRKLLPPRSHPPAPLVPQWPPLNRDIPSARPYNPQTVGTTFLGAQLSESGFIPPDSMGDVGPTQILVIINGRIKVFDKTGVLGGLNASTDAFFASVSNGAFTTDPHLRYDRLSGRWFITMLNIPFVAGNPQGPNRVLIAVSSGSTITDATSFTFFQFQQDLVGATPNSDTNGFADYDTLGVDKFALYIGTDMFDQNLTRFIGTTGFVVKKSDLLSATLTVTPFRQMAGNACPAGDGPYAPQGVNDDDPSATEGYFIGIDLCFFDLVQIRRVSNPGGTPTLSGNLTLTVPPERTPLSQVQPSPGFTLDALDDRLFAGMIHRNKVTGASTLWTAHNIQVDSTGVGSDTGGRNGSRWYEIGSLTTTPALVQSGTVFDSAATNPFGYWIPTTAVSGQGHMAIASSRASLDAVNGFASVAVAGRLRTDALGTTQPPTLAQSSSSIYNVQLGGPERWGDYSQTSVDPTDDQTFWTFQEYANATNSYAVRAIQLKAPPPASLSSCTPAVVPPTATQSVAIPGTSVSGSEFFDPGPDTGGPGYPNHLRASVSGGVTVNTVTFNSPTSVTLNVSTTTTGFKDVTITNPDGQSVVGTGCIFVGVVADLSITKDDGRTTAMPGQTLVYTIVASNAGPSPVTGATVTDTLPASLTGATWTCAPAAGASCTASGSGNINDTAVNLPVGTSVTYTLSATVTANPQSLSNTATITPPGGVIDLNLANNSATDTDQLICSASEVVVVPDGRVTRATIGAGATAWFGASLRSNYSYSWEFKNATGMNTPPGALTVFAGDDGCSGTSTVATTDTTGNDPPGAPGAARVSFTAAGVQKYFQARLVNASGSPIPLTFNLSDTTMFSPAWSSNGSFDTFYSFLNTTGAALSGTLTLLDTSGAVQSTFPVLVPAGQTASTNTGALGVTRNRTGTAKFTHNGPPGAILAEAAIANFTISPAYVQPVKFRPMREALKFILP